jgi:hypothetical protein
MKVTCPTCNGKELLDDLSLVETDLYYSRGNLRGVRQADSPKGPPFMSCKTCFGQGWVTTDAYAGGLFTLHQIGNSFWVLPDMPTSPSFEGHFAVDPSGTGFIVIRTDLNQGLFPAGIAAGFTILS